MKKICKHISLMLVLVLICCNTITIAIAGDTNYFQKETIQELKAINLKKIKDVDGYWYTMDLAEEVLEAEGNSDARTVSWYVVGVMSFKLVTYPSNNLAIGSWKVQLLNDYVKSVKGTLILEKDVLGLINPNYDKKQVNVVYSPAQYSLAVDQVAFNFNESNLSQNIIFRWTNFTIQGVTGGYSVAGDNVQGKVEDFC